MMTKPVPNEHAKPLISREDFFSSEEEKTKFNWVLFELATEFDYSICRDKVLGIDFHLFGCVMTSTPFPAEFKMTPESLSPVLCGKTFTPP